MPKGIQRQPPSLTFKSECKLEPSLIIEGQAISCVELCIDGGQCTPRNKEPGSGQHVRCNSGSAGDGFAATAGMAGLAEEPLGPRVEYSCCRILLGLAAAPKRWTWENCSGFRRTRSAGKVCLTTSFQSVGMPVLRHGEDQNSCNLPAQSFSRMRQCAGPASSPSAMASMSCSRHFLMNLVHSMHFSDVSNARSFWSVLQSLVAKAAACQSESSDTAMRKPKKCTPQWARGRAG